MHVVQVVRHISVLKNQKNSACGAKNNTRDIIIIIIIIITIIIIIIIITLRDKTIDNLFFNTETVF